MHRSRHYITAKCIAAVERLLALQADAQNLPENDRGYGMREACHIIMNEIEDIAFAATFKDRVDVEGRIGEAV